MRKFIVFVFLSFVALAAYDLGFGELMDQFPRALPHGAATFFWFYIAIPFLGVITMGWVTGIWSRGTNVMAKILGVVICLILPPVMVFLSFIFGCLFMPHECL